MATVQNTNRITGMFSGIDTDALVKALSMSQQNKVDQLNAKMQKAEWKKDLLTDFNNKIRVFRDTYGSVLSENSLMTKGAYSTFSVKMADNMGVSVSASSSAKTGNYHIRVDQIATAATMKGAKLTARTNGLTEAELNSAPVNMLTMDGKTVSGAINFTINGKEFTFNDDTSLKKIMDEVNKSGAGVTMAYSQFTDSITITNNEMGAYNGSDPKKTISFTDSTGFLAHLGLTAVTGGQDAVVYLNGETEARRLDSNSITFDGVTMNFMRPTDSHGVDFSLQPDYKPSVDRIKAFVEAYNTLIKELHTAYNQKVNRDYKPLTEEQRYAMSDKEIEIWETKAKEGMLYRDNTLGRLLEDMRGVLSKTFGGNGNLASIGLTTSRYTLGEPVQLELDEDKLTAALQADPDRVFNLMTATEKDGSGGGLIAQLNKMMDGYVNTIKGRELQNLTNDISSYSKRVKEQEDKLAVMSEKYYLQYAKLETALSKMQGQQDSMATMFGWNNNNN